MRIRVKCQRGGRILDNLQQKKEMLSFNLTSILTIQYDNLEIIRIIRIPAERQAFI
jgi:hypothetical protein